MSDSVVEGEEEQEKEELDEKNDDDAGTGFPNDPVL
jgi:hypothetical protein